jgi:hypothetical protein
VEMTWTERIANLAVDALLTAKLVKPEDFERAAAIVEEEIRVRLVMGDWPDDNNLNELQNWYATMCNGDWEHTYGITIETLDNPGWAMSIDLKHTPLYEKAFSEIKFQREDKNDWALCRIESGVFKADCGPKNLGEAISFFLQWANNATR